MSENKIDIAELGERATGGGFFMACRHPDIDDGPRDSDRHCVLDHNAPESCDQSAPPHGAVTDKTACPYWAPLPRAKPAGASAEELLALLSALEQREREACEYRAKLALQVAHSEASEARVAELTAEVGRLQNVVTAQLGALDGVEAYLLDRTVSEPGSERGEKTLSVLRGYKRNLDRDAGQIAAARWADQKRGAEALEAAQALVARLRGALEPFVAHYEPWMGDAIHFSTNRMSCAALVTYGQLRAARQALQEGE